MQNSKDWSKLQSAMDDSWNIVFNLETPPVTDADVDEFLQALLV